MPRITQSATIADVLIVELKPIGDSRGRFTEIFRKEWFPQRSWRALQSNRSESAEGTLRGLHYHHHQVDYWHVVKGKIRVALVDLRPGSGTFMASKMLDLDQEDMMGLYIPVGVAHGFLSLTAATLLYFVDNYYDGTDEFGVAWNDPELGLDWQIDRPVLSARDSKNPMLRDIPQDALPS